MLFIAMLLLGMMIGFVGAGGAGVMITLLVAGFDVPMHTALAVALTAMIFTTMSGAYSHFKEGEVVVKTGAVLGIGGVLGSFAGANVSMMLDSEIVRHMTSYIMLFSAVLLYLKVYRSEWLNSLFHFPDHLLEGKKLYIYGIIAGTINGFISGAFGIGAAAFIQLTLMIVFGVPLLQAIGTCMMVILPISIAGGLGYILHGQLDLSIFAQTLAGQFIGAYIGAKFTHLAPRPVLKFCIVGMSTAGGVILLLGGGH